MEEPRKLKDSELIDPSDELDDLGRAILRIELLNPGIRVAQIARMLSRQDTDWRTIKSRRESPLYQRAIRQAHKSALELAAEAETDAIRELVRLLKTSKSEKIRLSAAKALVGGTLEYRKMSLAKELARQQSENAPIKKVVEVVFRDSTAGWSAQAPAALPAPEAPNETTLSQPSDNSLTIDGKQANGSEALQNAPGSTIAIEPCKDPTPPVQSPESGSQQTPAPSWADVIGGDGEEPVK